MAEHLLDWLATLPLAMLYAAIAVSAAIENFFPPIPADTVAAFGSFLAARGHGSAWGAFLFTWVGNVAGAATMYWLGRKFGAERLERRLLGRKAAEADARLRSLHGKYGLGALFLSRFLPGVRALVPPFAGALGIPAVPALLALATASGIWYGAITWAGFRLGSDWQRVSRVVGASGRWLALGALVVACLGLLLWRRRHPRRPEGGAEG